MKIQSSLPECKASDSIKQSVQVLPENYSQIVSKKKGGLIRGQVLMAAILFLGGLVSYGVWFYQDWRFLADGVNTTGSIGSWQTQKSTSKGKTLVSQTINYQYKTESGEQHFGWDTVKTWRHIPESKASIQPKKDEEISIEYLRTKPESSRIIIRNRYQTEYFFSGIAMIAAGILVLIALINSLPTGLRLKCYGGLVSAFGLAFFAFLGYPLLTESEEMRRPGDSWLIALAFFSIPVPITAVALWYGYFLITRSQFTISDPRNLLNLQSIPNCGEKVTILPTKFLGTDAAIILDHQQRLIHFVNCHVAKGFIPTTKRLHTCAFDSINIEEKTYSTKQGPLTQAILTSPTGKTTLGMHQPGVVEFLDLLRGKS